MQLTDEQQKEILEKFDIDYFNGEATFFDDDTMKTLDVIDLTDLQYQYHEAARARLLEYWQRDGRNLTPENTEHLRAGGYI